MFFLMKLERQVTLHPSYFGRNMHDLVTGKLLKDVEGTCTGRYFIITIMDTFDISEGRILPGSGLAEFTVGYRAVVWRPFKGETVRGRSSLCLVCDLQIDRLMPLSLLSIKSASLQTPAHFPYSFLHR
jgi:DNA-directed RNA polymerase subunit E'/Rpb7